MTDMLRRIYSFINRHAYMNWAFADQAVISGSNFLMGILLARYLGLEGFGVFTLAWLAVLFIQIFQYSLITAPMMSIGPKHTESERPAYFGAVMLQQLAVSLLGSALLLLGLLISTDFFPEWGLGELIWPLVAASFSFQMQDFLRRYFFTRDKYAVAFINDSLAYPGRICLLFWLIYISGMTVANALWVTAASSIIAVVYGAFYVGELRFESRVFFSTTKRHWNFSKWLTGANLSEWSYINIFIAMVGNVLGPGAVGALKAAQNIVGVTHILLKGLENIIPIKAARHYKSGGSAALNIYLNKITLWMGAPFISLLALALIFPSFWLDLVYGAEYRNFGYVLQWYAIIYVVVFLCLPFRSGLQAFEYTKPILIANIFAAIFALLCAQLITVYFGLLGALMGILATNIVLLVTLVLSYRHCISSGLKK